MKLNAYLNKILNTYINFYNIFINLCIKCIFVKLLILSFNFFFI